MTERYKITQTSLEAAFEALARNKTRVVAPREVKEGIVLAQVATFADVAKRYLQSTLSPKDLVFPKVERMLSYRTSGKEVTLEDPAPAAESTVLFGIRPCEGRSFAALDAVFNWDCRDKFFNARMQATTIVTVACTEADESCFCTALGSGPDDAKGSDVLLHPLVGGGWAATTSSEKGQAFLKLAAGAEPLPVGAKLAEVARVEKSFEASALSAKLPGMWDNPIWLDQSLRCLGCGACAYVCPTCVCFDLQEEADAEGGRRLRCWDSCGLRLFTLHASGHNPRELQSQRWRQRVYHKFSYYPERLGMLGCVGCGKCSRACPVDMNLKEHLTEAAKVS